MEWKLAQARRRIEQLQGRVRELEQENAGLKQRNQDLLKSPFGKRSEKRQGGRDGGQGPPGTGSGARGRSGRAGGSRAMALTLLQGRINLLGQGGD